MLTWTNFRKLQFVFTSAMLPHVLLGRSVVSVGGGDGGFFAVGVFAWRWWAVGGRLAYSAKVGKVEAKNARQGAGGCTKALRGPAPVPPKTLI